MDLITRRRIGRRRAPGDADARRRSDFPFEVESGLLNYVDMDHASHSDPLIIRLREGVDRIALVLRADLWAASSDAGLNPAQAQVLDLLATRPAGLRPKETTASLPSPRPASPIRWRPLPARRWCATIRTPPTRAGRSCA